jgi:hypothetical protein
VDAFRELLFDEMEVLHEIGGRQDCGGYVDLGDVLFDLVLAGEVRDASADWRSRPINYEAYLRVLRNSHRDFAARAAPKLSRYGRPAQVSARSQQCGCGILFRSAAL